MKLVQTKQPPGVPMQLKTYPRLATRLPIIHPFTKMVALYCCPNGSLKVKDSIASRPLAISNLKVVTKNPTPAEPFGRPLERSRGAHPFVENPGRCHPFLSPKRPPSLNTPRVLSGKLNNIRSMKQRKKITPTYFLYPPTLPWTFHSPKVLPSNANPRMPRGLFELSVFAASESK